VCSKFARNLTLHLTVFCNIYGRHLDSNGLFYPFAKLLEEAGLPHIRFHDLRHSAATILLSMGVPMKVVQELLGHSDYYITANVYSHVLPSMQQEVTNKWDDFFEENESMNKDSGF
jgi:integrase